MMPARLPGSSAGALASTSGRDPSGGRRFGCCAAPTFVIIGAGLGNQTAPARKMRSVLVRCLVALLTLALSGGNASARLHALYAEQSTPHTQHRHEHAVQPDQLKPGQDKGLRCCCDNLGCVSAYTLTPNLGGVAPVIFGTTVHYGRQAVVLNGRVLLPEPEPPRLGSLT